VASDSDNKREHPRYEVDIRVTCSAANGVISAHTTNLSLGGVFVRTDHPLPVHSEVALTLGLPETDTTIETRGRVIWTCDAAEEGSHAVPGMAIAFAFLELSDGDQALLAAYLQRLAEGPAR
jgi:type IV pilus assembly protein PilZ